MNSSPGDAAAVWESLAAEANGLYNRVMAARLATGSRESFRTKICNRQAAIAATALGEVALWAQREAESHNAESPAK